MKPNSVIEGIRMGASDLDNVPVDSYTLGIEFEIAVDNSVVVAKKGKATEFDEWDEYSEWWNSGGSTFDVIEWINNLDQRQLLEFVQSENIKPKRPANISKKSASKHFKLHMLRLRKEFSQEEVSSVTSFLKTYADDPDSFLDDEDYIENIIKIFYYYYKYFLRKPKTVDQIIAWLQQVNDVLKIHNLITTQVAPKLISKFMPGYEDEDRSVYFYDKKRNLLSLSSIVSTKQLLDNFNVKQKSLVVYFEDEWKAAEEELLNKSFDAWSIDKKGGPGSEPQKINYVIDTLKNNLGISPVTKSSLTKWAVVSDTTSGVDAEIVTPVFSVVEGIQQLKKIFKLIQLDPAMTTVHATGLHLNIGTFEKSDIEQIDWLKFLIVVNADRVLDQFGRQHNIFATDRVPELIDSLTQNNLVRYRDNVKTINSKVLKTSDKFSAINLSKLHKDKIIEFRAPGNKGYEYREQDIVRSILQIIRAVEVAKNANLYKSEYLKILHVKYSTESKHFDVSITTVDDYVRELIQVDDSASLSVLELLSFLIINFNKNNLTTYDLNRTYTKKVHEDLVTKLYNDIDDHNKVKDYFEKLLAIHDPLNKIKSAKIIKALLFTLRNAAN